MRTFIKVLAGILLLINGIGAIYGGLHLITHPDGSSLQMTLQLLEHSPFANFLVPGILLLMVNGLFSLFVIINLVMRTEEYPLLIILQGIILLGWIVVECLMLQTVHTLHVAFAIAGVLLIAFGWRIARTSYRKLEIHDTM